MQERQLIQVELLKVKRWSRDFKETRDPKPQSNKFIRKESGDLVCYKRNSNSKKKQKIMRKQKLVKLQVKSKEASMRAKAAERFAAKAKCQQGR